MEEQTAGRVVYAHLSGLPDPKHTEAMQKTFAQRFVLSAGVILAITGITKILSGLGDSKFLAIADPIIGLTFRQLMLTVGLAEIVIVLVCFSSKRQTLALGLVAWLSTNFVVYRLGLWWMDWHRPCNCLGNLTDALHISPQVADNIMKVVLAYLLIGSYGLLVSANRLKSFKRCPETQLQETSSECEGGGHA